MLMIAGVIADRSWSSDPHVSVQKRTRCLARRRNTSKLRRGPNRFDRPFLPDEDHAIIELACFHEGLVTTHEVAERGHQRFRRLLEHFDDDDAIVGADSSTRPRTVRKRTGPRATC